MESAWAQCWKRGERAQLFVWLFSFLFLFRSLMNVLFFFLLFLFTVALAVHVGQLLEPRTPAVEMIEILLVVLCDQKFQTSVKSWTVKKRKKKNTNQTLEKIRIRLYYRLLRKRSCANHRRAERSSPCRLFACDRRWRRRHSARRSSSLALESGLSKRKMLGVDWDQLKNGN